MKILKTHELFELYKYSKTKIILDKEEIKVIMAFSGDLFNRVCRELNIDQNQVKK